MILYPEDLPYSAACERNQDAILNVISPYLLQAQTVLEIGSGTAQHAVHFAAAFPELTWQTSDQVHYLDGIHMQLKNAELHNIALPVTLDVNQKNWGLTGKKFDIIYTANTLHIMQQTDVDSFFTGLSAVADSKTLLIVYGPFKYAGKFTSDSNKAFDESLRSQESGSSIKNFETINALAQEQEFQLIKDYKMPANNQCLIWQKK